MDDKKPETPTGGPAMDKLFRGLVQVRKDELKREIRLAKDRKRKKKKS